MLPLPTKSIGLSHLVPSIPSLSAIMEHLCPLRGNRTVFHPLITAHGEARLPLLQQQCYFSTSSFLCTASPSAPMVHPLAVLRDSSVGIVHATQYPYFGSSGYMQKPGEVTHTCNPSMAAGRGPRSPHEIEA